MYYSLIIDLPQSESELLQATLDEFEPLGLEIRDETLKPPPGALPIAPGQVQVCAWFASAEAVSEAQAAVAAKHLSAATRRQELAEEDWSETWKEHVRPARCGRVWVGPPWLLSEAGDAPVTVVIEPGMAFGTGDHATTALCLEALDEVLRERPGASVLDVGTGSGVLAIAARKLGASRVVGNDVDPVAVRIARENALANGAEAIEITERPVERIAGRFDVVVANLFANLLCQLAPRLAARTAAGGTVLATGVLAEQAAEVQKALEREGLRLRERRERGEWVLMWMVSGP